MLPKHLEFSRRSLLLGIVVVIGFVLLLSMGIGRILLQEVRSVRANSQSIVGRTQFVPMDHNVDPYFIFDLGVGDLDEDGDIDLYTTNHDSRQSILLNDGHGSFRTDVLDTWKLNQSRGFPGYDPTPNAIPMERPGTYVFWQQEPRIAFVIQSHPAANPAPVRGKIRFASHFEESRTFGPASITTSMMNVEASRFSLYTIKFEISPGGRIEVSCPPASVPFDVSFESAVDLESVFVGAQGIHPTAHTFPLTLRDRHGMAWADLDGDGDRDVYITRGGLKGTLTQFPQQLRDELFIRDTEAFEDHSERTLVGTKTRPGRQVSWVDFNRDDRLDLTISSSKGVPGRLLQQTPGGTFAKAPDEVGLNWTGDGPYRWVQLDDDLYPEFVVVEKDHLIVYRNANGSFSKESICAIAAPNTLAVGDIDKDGDLDLFVSSDVESFLILNQGGKLNPTSASSHGLPPQIAAGTMVDFDNNGVTDLHLIPHGLYAQEGDLKFHPTHHLEWKDADDLLLWEARSIWFDADHDGALDVLTWCQKRVGKNLYWRVFGIPDIRRHDLNLFRNTHPQGNWLQITLQARGRNRNAIGAVVDIDAQGTKERMQVGQFDNARMSQGHYRLYLGLGTATTVDQVTVRWPSGQSSQHSQVQANQNLVIQEPERP